MRKNYANIKSFLAIMIVFAMVFQFVGPVMPDYAYAEKQVEVKDDNNLAVADEDDKDGDSEQDGDDQDKDQPGEDAEGVKPEEGEDDPTPKPDQEKPSEDNDDSDEGKEEKDKSEDEKEDLDKDTVNDKDEIDLIKLEEANEISPLAEPKDLGNIFTFKSLKVNGAEADKNQVVTIGDGTKVHLDYIWDTIGKDVNPGDYAEIDVPDAFKFDRDFEDQDIKLNDGTVVGTYSIINNKLRFVFDERIEEAGQVENGTLGFGVKFDEEKFQEDVVEEIEFNDKGKKTITIIGKPSGEISYINKLGNPDSDKDAKTITWVVDVTNPSDTSITDAKLKDNLPEGLELDSSSITVKDLNIKLNGELIPGNEVMVDSPKIDGQNFELDLPTIDPYKGYRIEYTTTIKDKSISQFTNDVSFEYGDNKLPADATVIIERSADIEKDGKKVKNKDEIDWWIDVNKSGGSINEAIVEDTLPTGVTLVQGSMAILKLTQNGDDWTESDSGKTADEFPVNLGEIEDAYRIRFKTSIDYAEVNDGEYQKDNSFTNKTTLKNGEDEIGEVDKTVKVSRDPILSKTGKQYVDYETKEIKWTVTVNKANHPIKDAIVKDRLPKGLTISKDDIVVKNSAGEVVTDKEKITVPTNDGSTSTEVTINLGDINEEYTIEYTTKITDFNIDEFFNGVSLGGTGVGPGGTIEPVPVKPAKNGYSKSYKGIDYDAKTMNWETIADPTREAFKTLKIRDTFPNHGLILIEDSLVVKIGGEIKTLDIDYTLTDIDGNHKNGFVIEFIGDVLQINNKIVITYKTSYDPAEVNQNTGEYKVDKGELKKEKDGNKANYINQAKFEGKTVNGKDVNITRNAQKQVNKETVNTGKKVGKLISIDPAGEKVNGWVSGNTRKIEWEVYTNYLKQDLGSVVSITDELGYEGEIDEDSIRVRKYTVAPGGGTELGEDINTAKLQLMELLSTGKYSVVMGTNKKSFTLSFNEDVNERYAITFTTSVPDTSQETYTNTANLKVGDKEYPYTGSVNFDKADNKLSKESLNTVGKDVYTDDEINWKIKINESLSIVDKDVKIVDTISTGMVYKEGSLKVYKVKGTERALLEDGYTLKEPTINDEGETILEIVFADSISSTYEIEYTTVVTATGGTKVNNSVEYSGKNEKIDSVTTTELKASQFSYVGGDPAKGKIIINKINSDEKIITSSEATFEVSYLLNGEKRLLGVGKFKTKNGKLELGNLILNRTYIIEEVEAPQGYIISSVPIEIEVKKSTGSGGTGTYEKEFINEKIKGHIQFTKKGEDDDKDALKDVEFTLYKRSDTAFKIPIKTAVSNESGLVEFKDVEYGEYVIKETNTPINYLPHTAINVEIEENDVVVKLDDVVNMKIRGNIELLKVDQDGNKLAGARFGLFRLDDEKFENPIKAATSGMDGLVKFEGVEYGKYKVKEISAPTSYVPSDKILEATVTENNKTIKLEDVVNTKVIGSVQLVKRDNEGNLLPGAEFSIYNKKDENFENPIGEVAESNDEGIVRFENIPYGDYIIRETSAPEGYIGSTKDIEVEINENDKTVYPLDVINTRIRGGVQLIKKDNEGNVIFGARFGIYGESDKNFENPLQEQISDGNGLVHFDDIPLGEYVVKEIKAPEGYIISDETREIEVKEENHKETTSLPEVTNTKIRGSVEFIKKDTEGKIVTGAKFGIYAKSDRNFENPLQEQISDGNGLVRFDGIAYGNYTVKEISAPIGYDISQEVVDVEIRENKKVVKLDDAINTKIRGNLEITKVRKNTDIGLSGAKIALYRENGVLIGEKESGRDGKILFENLEYGKYYFEETRSPGGYYINREKTPIEIKTNGEVVKVRFENTRRPIRPTRPTDPDRPDPERPTDPDPVKPTEPTDPDKPEPEDPEKPIIPPVPVDPTDPTEPEDDEAIDQDKPGDVPTPEYPGDETETVDPETPGDTTRPVPEYPQDTIRPVPEKDRLVKTGSINDIVFYIGGLILILAGLFVRRRVVK